MRTVHRLIIGLVALGFAALSAVLPAPAAAEPTPSPTAPPCKAGSLKLTAQGDIAVADAAGVYVRRTATVQNTTGFYYSDLTLTFDIWPDQGDLPGPPKLIFTGTAGKPVTASLRLVTSPRHAWRATRLKPPTVWPTGTPSTSAFQVAFGATSPVMTYSTRIIATATACGDTVLAATTAMRFGFKTSGPTASAPASAKPRTSASAKPSRKPSPAPAASGEEVLVPPGDETAPEESLSNPAAPDQDLASGDSSGSPLPWMAGLGVTALVVAGGLLWWVRRSSYDED